MVFTWCGGRGPAEIVACTARKPEESASTLRTDTAAKHTGTWRKARGLICFLLFLLSHERISHHRACTACDNMICQECPASSGKTSESERPLSRRIEFPDLTSRPWSYS
jgi:hypothetical protein